MGVRSDIEALAQRARGGGDCETYVIRATNTKRGESAELTVAVESYERLLGLIVRIKNSGAADCVVYARADADAAGKSKKRGRSGASKAA
jgi:hypothetical protein